MNIGEHAITHLVIAPFVSSYHLVISSFPQVNVYKSLHDPSYFAQIFFSYKNQLALNNVELLSLKIQLPAFQKLFLYLIALLYFSVRH